TSRTSSTARRSPPPARGARPRSTPSAGSPRAGCTDRSESPVRELVDERRDVGMLRQVAVEPGIALLHARQVRLDALRVASGRGGAQPLDGLAAGLREPVADDLVQRVER